MNDSTNLTPRREFWILLTLAGIQFTHIVDFMVMMPLGPEFTRIFSISDAQFGLLISAYTFAAGFSGLLSSLYVDRFSRKRLLLILYALFAVATLACGLAPTYETLMAARIAAGTFGGVLSALSQTMVADLIPFERRGRAMGIVMSSFSLATVLGVPLSLFLAAHLSWHAPFIAIALVSVVLMLVAWQTLPPLAGHIQHQRGSPWDGIRKVVSDPQHLKAFAFAGLLVFAAFTVIPYITLYNTTNAGMTAQQIPYIYLYGGLATLVSARWIGRLADSKGKVVMYRRMAVAAMLPILLITLTAGLPVWGIYMVGAVLFFCMSGRMIPGMALVTSACQPHLRGTFMALVSSVQSAAMGVAAFIGGHIISRDAQGMVVHYWMCAVIAIVAGVASVWLAPQLRLYNAPSAHGSK